jgi:hypothetical protein
VVQVVSDGQGDAVEEGVRIVDIGARPAGRLARMREQPRLALAAVRVLAPALVHFHDPELLPAGVQLAREGFRVVYDAHEDVPRQLLDRAVDPRAAAPAPEPGLRGLREPTGAAPGRRGRRHAAHHAALLAGGPACRQREQFPLPARTRATRAAARARAARVLRRRHLPHARRLRDGACAAARARCAAAAVRRQFEDAATEAALRAEPGWAQVDYLGVVGREQVREVMARSRAGLVTLLPLPSYLDSLPIKMFEYMSAELPVIASDFPLWREIVQRHGCGLCVNPADPAAIAQAIRALVDDPAQVARMGEAGRAAVHAHYHWPRAEAELLKLVRELLA